MSLNIYGNIGTTYTGIVTGAELERVSQEIFGGAKIDVSEKINKPAEKVNLQPHVEQTSSEKVNLYSRNVDINYTQQIAQTRAGLNVQLSPQAIQNIEALKTMAATQQTSVHKLSEGKIYVPVDNSQKSDVENVFAVSHPTSIIKAFSMDKDRKGSNPFSYTNLSSQNEEESAETDSAI